MEINKLEEEKQLLINRIKYLEERNNKLEEELKVCKDVIHNGSSNVTTIEDEITAYEKWLQTDEADVLANAYAEAMNIDIIKEVI
jgi:predicted  nucleic acid-binding Zn-ribbon protein